MIKNFENFLNENESIDPIKAVFNGSRDYTEIDNIDTFHNKMLSEIAAKLSSMNLTLPYKNSGRNLEVEFKRFADKEKTIQLSAEADSESGDIVYFYTWRDHDFWEGGYDLGNGRTLSLKDRGIKLPMTMGHETAGTVVAMGPQAKGVEKGRNYLVYPWINNQI